MPQPESQPKSEPKLPPAITIRTLETEAERQSFLETTHLAFGEDDTPGVPVELDPVKLAHWHEWLHHRSAVVPITLRAAYLNPGPESDLESDEVSSQEAICVGTYQMEERVLCLGPARLLAGCIGDVSTLPAFQRQGIASALMHDAIAWAKQNKYHLLLLNGILNFYGRFGYVNIMDYAKQIIALSDLARLPPSTYSVRAATEQDCADLLKLYQKHYNRFERSLALQQDHLRNRLPKHPVWIAYDEEGRPQGYLYFNKREKPERAQEFAANNWQATLALLQHHADLLKALPEVPAKMQWPRPFDTAAYEVADHLPVEWEFYAAPDGEWMALITDIPGFVRSLETLWQERWQRAAREGAGQDGAGRFTLMIGADSFTFEWIGAEFQLLSAINLAAPIIRFHPATFTRLIFGCRPIRWALSQPQTVIPQELIAVAEILYPLERIWIPPTDGF